MHDPQRWRKVEEAKKKANERVSFVHGYSGPQGVTCDGSSLTSVERRKRGDGKGWGRVESAPLMPAAVALFQHRVHASIYEKAGRGAKVGEGKEGRGGKKEGAALAHGDISRSEYARPRMSSHPFGARGWIAAVGREAGTCL